MRGKRQRQQVRPKTEAELEKMRVSCRMLGELHTKLRDYVQVGRSTAEIDAYGEKLIREMGAEPNFKNYQGYPAAICVSVNDEVVHGIPRADRILEDGDIVSLDCGLVYDGWHSDAARTWGVGNVHPNALRLIEATKASFFAGMRKAVAGNHLYDISNAIAGYLQPFGYGIVRDLTGHGIGSHLHEEPVIPNYRMPPLQRGILLEPGMTLAVEPMVTLGTWRVSWDDDGWTVRTQDGAPAAHYENTIAIREDGLPEILTLMEDEESDPAVFRPE
ncbi:MAG: type I methionyl aminopeptidase [Lachnospiraceae bacterium]|nr:type I methionyl aminopeptidase [Lachnospiraceae bacterium]